MSDPARAKRATWTIAAATGIGSTAGSVWYPFLPLYLFEVGAKDEADALYWFALALTAQGLSRLALAPVWGAISDRVGRKAMFVRAMAFLAITTVIVAFIRSPWQLIIALAFQGAFSGFSSAATALTSVSVPDSQIRRSMSIVSGALYLGSTLGPSFGALMALALGYRGAILGAAAMTMLGALIVYRTVPADMVAPKRGEPSAKAEPLEPFRPNAQLMLALVLFFALFSLQMLVRTALPIAIKIEAEPGTVDALVGLGFTVGSLGSAVGVLFLSGRLFRMGRLRGSLAIAVAGVAATFFAIAASGSPSAWIVGFFALSLLFGSMSPTNNTLIALNIPRSRRGTAFGFAGSAQALAFMAGPLAASALPFTGFPLGVAMVGGLAVALAIAVAVWLREPSG